MRLGRLISLTSLLLLAACGSGKPGTVRIPATEHDSPAQIAARAAETFCPNDPTYTGRFQAVNKENLKPENWSWILPPKFGIEITPAECRPAGAGKSSPPEAVNQPAVAVKKGEAKGPTSPTGGGTRPGDKRPTARPISGKTKLRANPAGTSVTPMAPDKGTTRSTPPDAGSATKKGRPGTL